MDSFYKELTEEEFRGVGSYNFDHPNAFDWDLARETIEKLCRHEDVVIPNYNYNTCKRDPPGINVKCTDLILFEGIFALLDPAIRDIMDLKIFVNTDDDIRLLRRLKRDVIHRGRTVEGVIKSYNRFVKAAYDEYIKPTMKYSDIIVPRGAENVIAIQFITENLKNRMKERGMLNAVVTTKIEASNMELQFPIVDDVLLKGLKSSSQIKVFDFSGEKDGKGDELKSSLERTLVRILHQHDSDIMPVLLQFLSKTLLKLFSDKNPTFKTANANEWQFINLRQDSWNSLQSLQMLLERLQDPQQCKHLCLFLPELASKNQQPSRLLELIETVYQLSYIHSIEAIHILTPFLGSHIPEELSSHKHFNSVHFYTLFFSNELASFPCFTEDSHHHHVINTGSKQAIVVETSEEIDVVSSSASMKIQAFNQKGQLDPYAFFEAFYGQELFSQK